LNGAAVPTKPSEIHAPYVYNVHASHGCPKQLSHAFLQRHCSVVLSTSVVQYAARQSCRCQHGGKIKDLDQADYVVLFVDQASQYVKALRATHEAGVRQGRSACLKCANLGCGSDAVDVAVDGRGCESVHLHGGQNLQMIVTHTLQNASGLPHATVNYNGI